MVCECEEKLVEKRNLEFQQAMGKLSAVERVRVRSAMRSWKVEGQQIGFYLGLLSGLIIGFLLGLLFAFTLFW